jgi:WD40 repeat protein
MTPNFPFALRRVGSLPDHAGGAQAIAWSPAAPTLATADMRSVHLWDAANGAKINDLFPAEPTVDLAWSPEGRLLSGSGSELWFWGRGMEHITLPTPRITCLDWSRDGRFIAWAGAEPSDLGIHIFDVARGDEGAYLEGVDAAITDLAWSPDTQWIAATAHDGVVRCWSAQSAQPLARLQGHEDASWCLAWSPNSRMLATGGLDGGLRVWDIAARTELRDLRGHASWIYAVAWSPGADLIISGSGDPNGQDRSIRLWNPVHSIEVGRVDQAHNDIIHALAWAPSGRRFASASGDERVTIWDVVG